MHPIPIETRFWPKIHKTKTCWNWIAALDTKGYGVVTFRGRLWRSHRVAWTIRKGEIPHGLHCLHKCDNPICVRPSHLFLGTHRDNVSDMIKKGRNSFGDKHATKLSSRQVSEILAELCNPRNTHSAIAKKYGVTRETITSIAGRKVWQSVEIPDGASLAQITAQRIGYSARGINHPRRKLNERSVKAIINAVFYHRYRGQQTALASKYGVHQYQIYAITTGKTWRHIMRPTP